MAKIYQQPTQIVGTVGVFPTERYALFGDDLATVTAPGYLNMGTLDDALSTNDIINAFYNYNLQTQTGTYALFTVSIAHGTITLTEAGGGGGSGTVNPGVMNQLAYYASSGSAVSGLATAVNGVLVTSAGGVPSISTMLPTGLAMQTPASINLTNGTALPVTGITATGSPSATTFLRGDSVWAVPAGAGTTWIVASTSQAMVAGDGYIANGGSLVTLTLPTTAVVGSMLQIQGFGAGGWSVAQNAGQSIHIGSDVSTVGAGGSVSSANQYDSLQLVCVVANTTWCALGGPQSAGLVVV